MKLALWFGLMQVVQSQVAEMSVHSSEQGALAVRLTQPLTKGLSSFNAVSQILLSMDADDVRSGSHLFEQARANIEEMSRSFEEAERTVSDELSLLDGQTESLTEEKNRLEREKAKLDGELAHFEIKRDSFKSTLGNYERALVTEKSNLNSAEWTLSDMRKKAREAETLRNVGIGFMFIPVIGLIPGAIMATVGQTDLNNAEDRVDRAEREVSNCISQINSYSKQVSDYEGLIYKANSDINNARLKISDTSVKLQALSEKRGMVADLQSKTRRAVHQVGLLSGVGSVAELQTRRMILLEPMVKVTEEILAKLGQIKGEDLLHTEDMRRIVSDMRDNHRALQADGCRGSSDEEGYCYT